MIASSQPDDADRVGEYWDALVQGTPVPTSPSDSTLAEAIHRFHAADDAPAADLAFACRLRQEILSPVATERGPEPGSATSDNPYAPDDSSPHDRFPRFGVLNSWLVADLATAAILLLTLVSAMLLARPQQVRFQAHPLSRPTVANSPATSSKPETRRFEATIRDVPNGATKVVLEQWEFKPDAAALIMNPGLEAHWIVAIEGSFAVSIGGVASTLTAGEGLVVPAGQGLVVEDTSKSAAMLLHGGIMAMYPPRQFDSRLITYRTPIDSGATMPGGAARVIVERVTVAPGTALPAFVLREHEWVGIGAGSVGVMLEGEHLPLYWQAGEEREYSFPSRFPLITPGTRVTVRNVAVDPLVLYHLSVIPADATGALVTDSALEHPAPG